MARTPALLAASILAATAGACDEGRVKDEAAPARPGGTAQPAPAPARAPALAGGRRDPYGRPFRIAPADMIDPVESGIAFRGLYRDVVYSPILIATCRDPGIAASRDRLAARQEAAAAALRRAGFGREMDIAEADVRMNLAIESHAGCSPRMDRNLAVVRSMEGALDRLEAWLPAGRAA